MLGIREDMLVKGTWMMMGLESHQVNEYQMQKGTSF